MTKPLTKWLIGIAVALVLAGLAVYAWQTYKIMKRDENIYHSNGRIEATEINIAPKLDERIKDILVHEGDYVKAGEIVANMETDVLNAKLREAKANLLKTQISVSTALSELNQRISEKKADEAVVKQREAELIVAEKRLARSSILVKEGATSQQENDDDQARYQSAIATKEAALAKVAASEAAIVTVREQVAGSESAVKAAQATVDRIQADINDSALKAPRDGRVQYRIAEPGEVLKAGGRVLNIVDLSDVYMTFFLPTNIVGKLALGDDVRLVLDALPNLVIPAHVTFIADVAQFTPKTVETVTEREKLMFRVKAHIPVDLLKKHISMVKTGLPGLAYVRLDTSKPWPDYLKVNE